MKAPPGTRSRSVERPLRPVRPLEYAKLGDPVLVTRAKDGDEQALAALVERHAPRVERLARHLLGDTEDARDAGQEALAKLCLRLKQFRGESQFATWLHRLTVNTCRDVADRQARRRHEPLHTDERESGDADPARESALSELRLELADGLAGISRSQADVLVLKDALDFSFEEIAALKRMPVGTAKCYAHRARAGMRKQLEGRVA